MATDQSPTLHPGAERIFTVDRILKKRKRKGSTEYLVKWKDYSPRHNTWEPLQNILDQGLIATYETRRSRRRSSSTDRPPKRKSSVTDEEAVADEHLKSCEAPSMTCDVKDEAVQTSTGQENESPNPLPGTVAPTKDIWFFVPPKKKWLRQEVSVTEVTLNQVTVTILESNSRDGFFKAPATTSPVTAESVSTDSAGPEQLPATKLEVKEEDSC